MTRIAVFAVPYSPNLGDGVIFECLAHGLRACDPNAEVIAVDLAGRTEHGAHGVRNRNLILKILPRLPMRLRHAIVRFALGRRLDKSRKDWVRALEGCDAAIIGGGQLFSDADLNFPLKIAAAAEVLTRLNIPFAVYAVGAADNWSAEGAQLFGEVVATELTYVSARDDRSRDILRRGLPLNGSVGVAVTPDPGLLAARCFPPPPKGEAVSICITAPEVLRYHADAKLGDDVSHEFFRGLAMAAAAQFDKVALFTNGAAEDEQALEALLGDTQIADLVGAGKITRLPRAGTPQDLCRIIAASRGVIAHRLHACIVAYSYGIPIVGLNWDRKVQSFFEQIGRGDLVVSDAGMPPADLCAKLAAEMTSGGAAADPAAHDQRLSHAQEAVSGMYRQLMGKA
jgi:polysaccharide pyruvyl transferase WcaK-like protein